MNQPDSLFGPFTGTLVDTSATGFRARHNRLSLASGQVVTFDFEGRVGRAVVVWTRIVNGRAETGLHIVSSA
jgi:hypothetical protein